MIKVRVNYTAQVKWFRTLDYHQQKQILSLFLQELHNPDLAKREKEWEKREKIK